MAGMRPTDIGEGDLGGESELNLENIKSYNGNPIFKKN